MFQIFSVDDHIVEPADLWSSRVPNRFRDTAPRVIEEDGREFWVYENDRTLTMGLNAVAGRPREEWGLEPTRFSDMIPGCYDPAERARDLLSQGVLASVSFPTLPRFGGMLFVSFKDKELADVCVRAWNDFVLDEWCPGGPEGLFVPMVICQVWDPELAVAEIGRCVDKGAKALCFVENPVPAGLPGFHTAHWDPVWRIAEEAGLPVCMHIGSSGYVPVTDPSASFATVISLANVSGMLALVNLVLSPVCHNFPRLKIVFSEAGIGWIPPVLERADRQIERHQYWAGKPGALTPSEIFARNMYVCMVEEPFGLSVHDRIGTDRIFSETDYPHSDTTYPHVQETFAELFSGLPESVIRAVSHENAERVFDWKMADPGLFESAEIAAWRGRLESDPYAAMERTCAADPTVSERLGVGGDVGVCQHMVLNVSLYQKCHKPVGPDGLCPDGHKTTA